MAFFVSALLGAALLYSALVLAVATVLLVLRLRLGWKALDRGWLVLALVLGSATVLTRLVEGHTWALVLPVLAGLLLAALTRRVLADFSAVGRVLLLGNFAFALSGLCWGVWFVSTAELSDLTRALLLAALPLGVLTLPIALLGSFEQWEVLARLRWQRPRSALEPSPRERYPRVLIQVPCYAEPPELVKATLDSLARLDYPNFAVMVIDNNTRDPELWQPLEAHCRHLGERFQFFHVEKLAGAKAGALNFALRHTPDDVEIIGVVDSDYQASPDFLKRLVGHFDDEKIGFVQSPHDYREWESSLYQRLCYWEYRGFFASTMVSLNERDAGLTVGTMCLIRRRALEEAGGWSEWCQTEDSELAIRIHACGYSSVYVEETFGRGLIPETFAGYKKQRFRWTFGPIQEFRHHLKLYLPRPWGTPSALNGLQKLHHLNHGLAPFSSGLGVLLSPIGAAAVASLVWHGEQVVLPPAVWTASAVSGVSGFILTWLLYAERLGCRLGDVLGALLAKQALAHVAMVATVRGLFTDRIPWRRTNKFKSLPSVLGALYAVRAEIAIGTALVGTAGAALAFTHPSGLLLLLLLGVALQGLGYFAAPAMALLAEWELWRAERPVAPALPRLAPLGAAFAAACAALVLLPRAEAPRPVAPVGAVAVRPQSPVVRGITGPSRSAESVEPSRKTALRLVSLARPSRRIAPPLPELTTLVDSDGESLSLAGEIGRALGEQVLAGSAIPEEIASLIPAAEPLLLTAADDATDSWTPESPSEDCYHPEARLRDYRCQNRKN